MAAEAAVTVVVAEEGPTIAAVAEVAEGLTLAEAAVVDTTAAAITVETG
jgi:hypothetical protein